jgi:hypothetical protein
MFAGRLAELEMLEAALRQTRARHPRNFLLTGERGIGKTSLIEYARFLATGQLELSEERFNFLVITVDVETGTTRMGLARRIERELSRGLGQTEKARQFLAEAWQVVRRFEVAGVRLRDPANVPDEESLLDELAHSIAETARGITDPTSTRLFGSQFDGILLMLDEADNASGTLALGAFLKLLLERIQRKDCHNVMVGLAGLPRHREVLHQSHESSLRLFDEYLLERLSQVDCESAVRICLGEANKLNVQQTTITPQGLAMLVHLSEGYPHFIQQVGYCAFQSDTDLVIDENDVLNGAGGPSGAIEQIGNRYYRNAFYNKIQKESYRQVLRLMANRQDDWITKDEIRAQFSGSETTLTNALQALRSRNIILDKEGERGVYRLSNKAFAWWISLQGETAAQLASPVRGTG